MLDYFFREWNDGPRNSRADHKHEGILYLQIERIAPRGGNLTYGLAKTDDIHCRSFYARRLRSAMLAVQSIAMFSMTRVANSLVLTLVAPGIMRSKS